MAKKIFLIFLITIIARVFFSSCICEIEPTEFQFISMESLVFDNTNYSAPVHTSHRNALAIWVQVLGEIQYEYAQAGIFTFQQVNAMGDCSVFYTPEYRIQSIEVNTLMDFSPDIEPGTSISHLFLATRKSTDFLYKSNLYSTIGQLIDHINLSEPYNTPEIEFYLYLKEAPVCDSIQLEVSVILENNNIIRDTTPVITFID